MRIFKNIFRYDKCRKACKYRLYRHIRTFKEIIKKYSLICFEIYEVGEEINRTLEEFLSRGIREGVLRNDLPPTQTVLVFWAALSGVVQLAAQKRDYLELRLNTTAKGFLRFGAELLLESIRRR